MLVMTTQFWLPNLVDFVVIVSIVMMVVTSCKHMYHPFCLGELLRSNNKCFLCGKKIHLNWMRSWGFCDEDDAIK
jgi:hypothetical protein